MVGNCPNPAAFTQSRLPVSEQSEERVLLAEALVQVARTACWPDGSSLLDLDETIIRDVLAPHLERELTAYRPGNVVDRITAPSVWRTGESAERPAAR